MTLRLLVGDADRGGFFFFRDSPVPAADVVISLPQGLLMHRGAAEDDADYGAAFRSAAHTAHAPTRCSTTLPVHAGS